MIETVAEHCKHKDCVYRTTILGYIPICGYCLIEEHSRGCRISRCDKYIGGPTKRQLTWKDDSIFIEWRVTDEYTIHGPKTRL